jgi:hypothetical protein
MEDYYLSIALDYPGHRIHHLKLPQEIHDPMLEELYKDDSWELVDIENDGTHIWRVEFDCNEKVILLLHKN